jgi:hypothetical protein
MSLHHRVLKAEFCHFGMIACQHQMDTRRGFRRTDID